MIIVPTVRTPITAKEARDFLLSVMPGLDRESAALLLALVWVETGRGGVLNNNPGNFSAGASWSGDAWRPPWFLDSAHPTHARMLAGEAPSAFRSYSTMGAGFADFARGLLKTFPTVVAAAATGDPASFVRALHDSGYSRDYAAKHIGTFASLRHEFLPIVSHLPGGTAGGVAGGLFAAALVFMAIQSRKKWRSKRSKRT